MKNLQTKPCPDSRCGITAGSRPVQPGPDFVRLANAIEDHTGGAGAAPASALDTLTADDAAKVKCAGCETLQTLESCKAGKCHKCGAAVTLANESTIVDSLELECCFANETVADKDGFVQLAPFGDHENTTPDGLRVVQRFTADDAKVIKNEFDQAAADEAEAFAGVPIYRGHPDRDGTIPRGKDSRKIGRTLKLDVRSDGLYGTRLFNSTGSELVKSGAARYPSVNWFAKPSGMEAGKLVMRPFELISWGATPKPNLPVKPLVNERIMAIVNAGTSEGAVKGWETRKMGSGGQMSEPNSAHNVVAVDEHGSPISTQVWEGGSKEAAKRALEWQSEGEAGRKEKVPWKKPVAHVFIQGHKTGEVRHYDLSKLEHVSALHSMAETGMAGTSGMNKSAGFNEGGILSHRTSSHNVLAIASSGSPTSTQVWDGGSAGAAKTALHWHEEGEKDKGNPHAWQKPVEHVYIHSHKTSETHHYDMGKPEHVSDLKNMAGSALSNTGWTDEARAAALAARKLQAGTHDTRDLFSNLTERKGGLYFDDNKKLKAGVNFHDLSPAQQDAIRAKPHVSLDPNKDFMDDHKQLNSEGSPPHKLEYIAEHRGNHYYVNTEGYNYPRYAFKINGYKPSGNPLVNGDEALANAGAEVGHPFYGNQWHTFAGGTFAAEGKHGYSMHTEHGEYHVHPVSTSSGQHRGYNVSFADTKGKTGGGLWHDLGIHNSPNAAKGAAHEHGKQFMAPGDDAKQLMGKLGERAKGDSFGYHGTTRNAEHDSVVGKALLDSGATPTESERYLSSKAGRHLADRTMDTSTTPVNLHQYVKKDFDRVKKAGELADEHFSEHRSMTEPLSNAGTSEGAVKGWETRKGSGSFKTHEGTIHFKHDPESDRVEVTTDHKGGWKGHQIDFKLDRSVPGDEKSTPEFAYHHGTKEFRITTPKTHQLQEKTDWSGPTSLSNAGTSEGAVNFTRDQAAEFGDTDVLTNEDVGHEFHGNQWTAAGIRKALNENGVHPDTIGKDKTGAIVVRRGFFYRHGGSSDKLHGEVTEALAKAGVQHGETEHGEHNAPFRGGASTAQSSHWYVKIHPPKADAADTTGKATAGGGVSFAKNKANRDAVRQATPGGEGKSRFNEYGQGVHPDVKDRHVTEFENEDLNKAELLQKHAALVEGHDDEAAKLVEKHIKSLKNDVSEPGGTPATTTGAEKMDKLKLIALLASVGVNLANDASEEAIETAMTETFGKVKAADELKVALTNDKTKLDADLKVATDKVSELTTTLTNEQATAKLAKTEAEEAKAKSALAEGEKTRMAEQLKVAETTLANAREERAKTAGDASKLATDLTEAKTKLGLSEVALTNERTEKSKLVQALTNAKKGIADLAVQFGKITPAQRPTLDAALANDVEFAGICDQLAKAQPVFKMAPILVNVAQANADGVDPEKQYRLLVNETIEDSKKGGKKPLSHQAATIKVNQSERGKALLALMHQPETGIPVVR